MPHDLIIRNGTVIDGTAAAGRPADVAVDGERITALGDLAGAVAAQEIDATGLTVTPGFVDLHTHLDAQIGWDPFMTSSSKAGHGTGRPTRSTSIRWNGCCRRSTSSVWSGTAGSVTT
jgi:N-acyl-D-aspartate/D-glutamate deacylase